MENPFHNHRVRMMIFLCVIALGCLGIYLQISYASNSGLLGQQPLCKDCNVLLVTIDSCSARNIGCYGYKRDTMPNFCAFAKENILFSQAYANAHWTLPSNISLFTGLYPANHQVQTAYSDTLSSDKLLLHEALQANGYKTFLQMPRQAMYLPEASYIRNAKTIVSNSTNVYDALSVFETSVKSGNKTFLSLYAQPYCHEPYLFHTPGRMFTQDSIPGYSDLYQNDELFSEGFYKYLLEKLPGIISENEFAEKTYIISRLYDALLAAKNFVTAENVFYSVLKQAGESEGLLSNVYDNYRYGSIIDPKNKDHMTFFRALYDERLFLLDSKVLQPIRNAFNRNSLYNNTILIIVSQHGQEHGEHGVMGHHTDYDQNLHVPFMMRIPGVQSTTVKQQAQLVDIMPTILDIVGVRHTYSFDGISLVPFISGAKRSMNRLLIAQQPELITVREENWKLFFRKDDTSGEYIPYELYDTNLDPDEQHNILFMNVPRAKLLINRYVRENVIRDAHKSDLDVD